ncbi:uncharacterized protein LOC126373035 [Pectinophora gossypiella]|uniref:uncharacterized protein LOC126373035 n=1 Tax=Pectinophora gossypiella TaxID=13191 RepID=UPI00214E6778|nr:uncharacterized protein LOC126373035 [Pectinophora gossypiella]
MFHSSPEVSSNFPKLRKRIRKRMPPNTVDIIPVDPDVESVNINNGKSAVISPAVVQRNEEKYGLRMFVSSLTLLANILTGMCVAVALLFAFRAGLPLGATPQHIVLCVIGYQLLMAHAILSLSSESGWTSKFRMVDKRRVHWILQILGSGLAITGSFIKILDKTVHWNTIHGQFALVALVFTTVSLVNGCTSLWAYELKRFLPMNLSKIAHICLGTVGFVAANITFCHGMDKSFFRSWATDALANTFISFVAIMTFIVILNPLLSFYTKTKSVFKK